MLKISVPLTPPSVNHYKMKDRRGHWYVSKEATAFKAAVAIINAGREARLYPGKDRYHVHIAIFLAAKQRLDIDNGLKVTLDALKDCGAIHSDAAVTALSVAMGRDPDNPRTDIDIEVL